MKKKLLASLFITPALRLVRQRQLIIRKHIYGGLKWTPSVRSEDVPPLAIFVTSNCHSFNQIQAGIFKTGLYLVFI